MGALTFSFIETLKQEPKMTYGRLLMSLRKLIDEAQRGIFLDGRAATQVILVTSIIYALDRLFMVILVTSIISGFCRYLNCHLQSGSTFTPRLCICRNSDGQNISIPASLA